MAVEEKGGGSVDTSQGLITPEWVARVKVSDDQRPETPSDPESLTEDVSKVYPRAVNLFLYFYPLDLGIESQGLIVQLQPHERGHVLRISSRNKSH